MSALRGQRCHMGGSAYCGLSLPVNSAGRACASCDAAVLVCGRPTFLMCRSSFAQCVYAVLLCWCRAGLDPDTEQLLREFDQVVYISCNPETLAKNLNAVADTHEIERFAVFDQVRTACNMYCCLPCSLRKSCCCCCCCCTHTMRLLWCAGGNWACMCVSIVRFAFHAVLGMLQFPFAHLPGTLQGSVGSGAYFCD
jgi:hypothetical protein